MVFPLTKSHFSPKLAYSQSLMRIHFFLPSIQAPHTESFFAMAGELAKSHDVRVFNGKSKKRLFDGMTLAPFANIFQQSLAVIYTCFARIDAVHFVDSTLIFAPIIRLFHPYARFIYSGLHAPTFADSLLTVFVDQIIVHDANLQKPYLRTCKIVPVFMPYGIAVKRFAIDSRVLSAFHVLPFGFFVLHAEATNKTTLNEVITLWKTLSHEEKRGVKLIVLGRESYSVDCDTLFIKSLSRDAMRMVFAGALAHLFFTSANQQDSTVLEALSFGRPVICEQGAVSDRRLEFAQMSTKNNEELFAFMKAFIANPLEAAAFGHTGRTLAEGEFAKEVLAKDWEMMYTKGLAYGEGYLSARER